VLTGGKKAKDKVQGIYHSQVFNRPEFAHTGHLGSHSVRGNNNTWDLTNAIPDDLQEAGKFSVLVLLPKTIPLTYLEPPVGELDVDEVQCQLQAIDDSALAWATGIEGLVDKANGKSLVGEKPIIEIAAFFPYAQRETIKKALSPPMRAVDIYCKQQVVLGDDNQVIHDHLNKEGNTHMTAFLSANKEARDAFKSHILSWELGTITVQRCGVFHSAVR
jgi:hypothetical protein